MRRVIKKTDSQILLQKLKYKKGNKHNKRIAEILMEEQKHFCAYSDERVKSTDAMDVEHFNPKLKYSDMDSYENWFFVKHKVNNQKSTKWDLLQPVLHPTAHDFEDRIVYFDGDYIVANKGDEEAENLIKLLNLDDAKLAKERKSYIQSRKMSIEKYGDALEYFKVKLKIEPAFINYPRAIKEEFGVDILSMLP
jgi:uncharacterized protein (TIGR02646 family)